MTNGHPNLMDYSPAIKKTYVDRPEVTNSANFDQILCGCSLGRTTLNHCKNRIIINHIEL